MSYQEIAKNMIDQLPSDKLIFVIDILEAIGEMSGVSLRAPKSWDELTEEEIDRKLEASERDIQAGRVYTLEEVDQRMKARYHWN